MQTASPGWGRDEEPGCISTGTAGMPQARLSSGGSADPPAPSRGAYRPLVLLALHSRDAGGTQRSEPGGAPQPGSAPAASRVPAERRSLTAASASEPASIAGPPPRPARSRRRALGGDGCER